MKNPFKGSKNKFTPPAFTTPARELFKVHELILKEFLYGNIDVNRVTGPMPSAVMLKSFFSKSVFQLNLTIGPFKLSPAASTAFHSGQSCLPLGRAVPDDGEVQGVVKKVG